MRILYHLHHLIFSWLILACVNNVSGTSLIKSSALLSCMANSQFSASTFDVTFFPNNSSVSLDVNAISLIDSNVTAEILVSAYGIVVANKTIDLCSLNVAEVCPLQPGHIDVLTNQDLSKSITDNIPGVAYSIPNLDGQVQVTVYGTDDMSTPLACLIATLSNGKTVQTKYASIAIGVICALGLLSAGIMSIMGYHSTAAHIASNTVSLFLYFQSVAIISMMAVYRLPPIAAAWAQNFQWTMGLMKLTFMQNIFAWYVQATGGTALNILPNKDALSIEVSKRDITGILPMLGNMMKSTSERSQLARNIFQSLSGRSLVSEYAGLIDAHSEAASPNLFTRSTSTVVANTTTDEASSSLGSETLILRGIARVAYLAEIELSNVFLTGLTFFVVLGVFFFLFLAIFKGCCELLVKFGAMHPERYAEYRRDWRNIAKGLLFRLVLVGFPQLSVLCLWELTEHDSVAVVILAVLTYLIVFVVLVLAAYKVITIAKQSVREHNNPAYILFSDANVLDRWGFLYIQFRATAYYFVVPMLIYTFSKSCFIAFGQQAGKVQALGILIIETVYCIGLIWLKPYMDRTTNSFNIAIATICFLNSIFFLFFSALFSLPNYVSSFMAVAFFILNAVFSLILLIMIIVSCIWALFSRNPDTRYQPMKDDRISFMPDNGGNGAEKAFQSTELNALGETARNSYLAPPSQEPIYEDSYSNNSNPYISSAGSSSQQSLHPYSTNNSNFPQARLPRGQPNPFYDSSSDLERQDSYPHRQDSSSPGTGFPVYHNTSYRGYLPADHDQQDNPYNGRVAPQF